MTIKEQLLQEIQSSSDNLLEQTLDFLRFLKTKEIKNVEITQKQLIRSTGKNLVEHLKEIDSWSGDDVEECLKNVKETRSGVKFDISNPFDEE